MQRCWKLEIGPKLKLTPPGSISSTSLEITRSEICVALLLLLRSTNSAGTIKFVESSGSRAGFCFFAVKEAESGEKYWFKFQVGFDINHFRRLAYSEIPGYDVYKHIKFNCVSIILINTILFDAVIMSN